MERPEKLNCDRSMNIQLDPWYGIVLALKGQGAESEGEEEGEWIQYFTISGRPFRIKLSIYEISFNRTFVIFHETLLMFNLSVRDYSIRLN